MRPYISTIIFSVVFFFSYAVNAQDDLLNMLEDEIAPTDDPGYTYATFKTTRIINGQSVENTAGGHLNFIIGHRFGKINDGVYEFFGLDQATIRLGLEYGITDWFNIGIGRSSYMKTLDGYLKFKMLRQSNNFPFTATLYTNAAMNGMKWSEPDRQNYFSSRMSYAGQLLLARKFTNALSLQLSPSYVHRNLVETAADQNDIFAIGVGGRIKVSNRVSLNAEYFYQLPGVNADKTYNSVALGVDIETGGHVFQLQVTNSKGMIEQYFIPTTTGNILDGDIYFGFNINRVFTIKKQKQK
jgi:hypothetical protein